MRDSGTSGPSGEGEAERSDRSAQRDERRRLTAASLDGLLARLDSDRDRAGERYEELRLRLHGLLRWWGSDSPYELADRILDRVASKLHEGAPVTADALPGYVRGVARLVFHESLRERKQEEHALRDTPADPAPVDREDTLAALDTCLDTLAVPDRTLIISYYSVSRTSMIESRRRLANSLRLSSTALRIRAHRLRQRLEECLAASGAGGGR